MSLRKKSLVPLEEALSIAGSGLYTKFVTITTGTVYFCALMSCQAFSVVLPAVSCDLKLSDATKGAIASMTFTGMLFSGQLFGFLADNFGRKKVALYSQLCTAVVLIICGLAPNTLTLMVMLFLSGFVVAGVLTPAFVYLSEFTATKDRAKALVALTAIGALASVYLPGMAWLIMPLDINIPIVYDMRFTSWRLFIILLTVPTLLSTLLLWKLPESPKFLLSHEKPDETLDVLKSVFAINKSRRKESFPVTRIRLDSTDQACDKVGSSKHKCFNYFKMMMKQTALLFSKDYIFYTLLSIGLIVGIVGGFNTLYLWFPDHVSRIRHFSSSNDVYNVTLCDVISARKRVEAVPNCQLNYNFFLINIILGSTQFVACLISSVVAAKIGRKLFMIIAILIPSAVCCGTLFITDEYGTIASLGSITLLLYLAFPVSISLILEFFPTPLRSTATSIVMFFGRLGATVGSQVMGALYADYCEEAYIGLTVILAAVSVLCFVIPVKN